MDISMNSNRIRRMTITGILSALSIVLYMFDFSIVIFPSFLKIDFTDLPGIIGTIMFDFRIGVAIALIKNIIHGLFMSSTNGIGEVANFIVSISFIIPFGLFYHKSINKNKFLLGCLMGSIIMTITACFMNYFVTIPLYMKILEIPFEVLAQPNFSNKDKLTLFDFIIFIILPFNLIKSAIVSFVSYTINKYVVRSTKKEVVN